MSVTVKTLSKQFHSGDLPAVQSASFVAPTGAITSLLGPSGSGKTTLLRLIAGLERPDSGTVQIGEDDCTQIPVQKRGVGFVFQGYALFGHMTVRKNIAFGLKIQKQSKSDIAARVEELLSLVQLEQLGDRYPHQLSGGQRQRVALARALATRPRVLLLDEPFGALDARVRLELREWLRQLHHKTNVTTILVTHDQDEALELSQQVVVMHQGQVQQVGTPHDIYDSPATPFVASFVGNANILRGRVESGRAALGPLSVEAPHGTPDGSHIHAFVRPHEVKISKPAPSEEPTVSHAVIQGLTRVGGFVKVELRIPSIGTITLELSKVEVDSLAIKVGDHVLADLGAAKIFLGDYAI